MKKLKNEQGVTILMALLLVLTAAVVSAVILSAALSAARRVNGDRGIPRLPPRLTNGTRRAKAMYKPAAPPQRSCRPA